MNKKTDLPYETGIAFFYDENGELRYFGKDGFELLRQYLLRLPSKEAQIEYLSAFDPMDIVNAEIQAGRMAVLCECCYLPLSCSKKGRPRKKCRQCSAKEQNLKRRGEPWAGTYEYSLANEESGYPFYYSSEAYERFVRRHQVAADLSTFENFVDQDGMLVHKKSYRLRTKRLLGTVQPEEVS